MLWGAPRIHGELLKLGFAVAQSTVAKYMAKIGGSPSGQSLGYLPAQPYATHRSPGFVPWSGRAAQRGGGGPQAAARDATPEATAHGRLRDVGDGLRDRALASGHLLVGSLVDGGA